MCIYKKFYFCTLWGLNTLQTYVEWTSHEKSPGNYNFSGENDIVSFLKIAHDLGLDVILRPGPFIDAERDLGGLPSWLLKYPNIKLRTSDKTYMEAVTSWYTKLFSVLRPLLFPNGGPIIMVQVHDSDSLIRKSILSSWNIFAYTWLGITIPIFPTPDNLKNLFNTRLEAPYRVPLPSLQSIKYIVGRFFSYF